jgi:hypothetical protein
MTGMHLTHGQEGVLLELFELFVQRLSRAVDDRVYWVVETQKRQS